MVVHRSGCDAGFQSTTFPVLIRSNYGEWSILMKVILQARFLWDAIETGTEIIGDERSAMEAILRGVPKELVPALGAKKTAKEAWDALKSMRMGSDAVREAKAQGLAKEFEAFKFWDGECIDECAVRLATLVTWLAEHGETLSEGKVVRKFLRAVPRKFSLVAYTIESTVNLDTTSLEEISGRLKAAEERLEQDGEGDAGGKLLLTEEEWRARSKRREGDGSGSSNSGGNKTRGGKNRGKGKAAAKPAAAGNSHAAADEPAKDQCRYCGKLRHWARDCRKKNKGEAHLVQPVAGNRDQDEPTLLMASATLCIQGPMHEEGHVFLNKKRAEAHLRRGDEGCDGRWYLDSGASNHMSGDRAAFADLDQSVTGKVKFGAGSLVDICGRGTVVFAIHSGDHRALTGVYYIPRLRTSIVSLGQLDESDCDTRIHRGMMTLFDRRSNVLAQVPRSKNRLYVVRLEIARPICLAALPNDDAWRWHARLGHQHFQALQRMHSGGSGGMVRGLPHVDHVEQLCDACHAGKERWAPFPQQAKFRAAEPLELVHADLCGPITPATLQGNCYFMLLVDDASRYMWITLMPTKDGAAQAIKHFKAGAEVQADRKLRTFRTDRGGEFNSNKLAHYFADHGVERHLTAPYSAQQNGVVERRNQTVVGTARSMMKAKGMPSFFRGEAVATAVYILNRSFTRAVDGKTPYEAWHGDKPSVEHLRVFGCVAHAKVTKPGLKKLDDRSVAMVFIGYEQGSKAASTTRIPSAFMSRVMWCSTEGQAGTGGSSLMPPPA